MLIGETLGPYRVLSKVGEGGMGEVYRARDGRLNRDVAVKILPQDVARDPERLDRFEREARASAALNHPNIIATYDVGHAEGLTFVVMEILDGATLRSELTAQPPTPRKAVEWTIQIANGLAAAHARGIVHRDIKPENLFVTSDGRIKILDFGIARFTAREASATAQATVAAGTEAGKVLGTVGYMSPEQVRGGAIDARSDIFALGVVLYEMLAGHRAFAGDTAVETMHAILKADPPEFTGQSVPGGLDRIVRRCLEKRPEDRFHSAHDLALALEAVTGSRTQPVSSVSAAAPRRRGLMFTVAAATIVLAVAAAGGGWWFAQSPGDALPTIRQVTTRRGSISAARYSAAGDSVVYSARFGGAASAPFETRLNSREGRQIGPANSLMLSASAGTLALGLNPRTYAIWQLSTLASLPSGASVARELLQNVLDADFAGDSLVAIEHNGNESSLHFPVGTVVYRTAGTLHAVRAAPDGKSVAVLDRGQTQVIHVDGTRVDLHVPATGLAWAADGLRLWFSMPPVDGQTSIHSTDPRRPADSPRVEWRTPGNVTLQDITRDGRLLVRRDDVQSGSVLVRDGTAEPLDLSWLDQSSVVGMAPAAGTVLLNDGPGMYLRNVDGSPALHLGDSIGRALSADGRLVIAVKGLGEPFQLVPVGPGTPKELPTQGIESFFAWFHPDGKRIAINGRQQGGTWRHYMMNMDGTGLTPFGPDNLEHYVGQVPLSNDGRWLCGFPIPERVIRIYPVDGGDPIVVKGLQPQEVVIRFAEGDHELFVFDREALPARIYRLDFRTGERTLVKEFQPADRAGIRGIPTVVMSADARLITFNYTRVLSSLYEVSGLGKR